MLDCGFLVAGKAYCHLTFFLFFTEPCFGVSGLGVILYLAVNSILSLPLRVLSGVLVLIKVYGIIKTPFIYYPSGEAGWAKILVNLKKFLFKVDEGVYIKFDIFYYKGKVASQP